MSDYVVKNWHQNYAGRGRPYDFGVYAVTWPAQGFLFDQAERQGISYFNYGEAVAGVVAASRTRTARRGDAQVTKKFAKSDLGALRAAATRTTPRSARTHRPATRVCDSHAAAGCPADARVALRLLQAKFTSQVATNSVPAFNYIIAAQRPHRGHDPGPPHAARDVADNDYGLGQIVDLISHSPVWKESLILVIEDDSQDGADHVDAHRMPALVISPYAKRGAVVHTRYDFLVVHPHAGDPDRDEAARPVRRAGGAAVRRVRRRRATTRALHAIAPTIDLTTATRTRAPTARRRSGC